MYVGTLFLKHKGHTRRHAFTRWRHECHQRHRAMLEATIEDLKRKPEGELMLQMQASALTLLLWSLARVPPRRLGVAFRAWQAHASSEAAQDAAWALADAHKRELAARGRERHARLCLARLSDGLSLIHI